MNEWEAAALLGPLGNCFSDFADKADGGPVQLASGGIGAAPLLFWAEELLAKGVEFGFYAGFKSIAAGTTSAERRGLEPFYSLIEDRLPGAVIVTEDGSGEKKGLVTDYFAPGTGGTVYTCGPLKMMTVVMEKCRAGGAECFVSMERRMACGVGACLGCAISTTTGNRRCCADGPIFNARDLGKRH
jgi:NAD(P)H-flavin reductase